MNQHHHRAGASLAVGNAVTVEGQLVQAELGVLSSDPVRLAPRVGCRLAGTAHVIHRVLLVRGACNTMANERLGWALHEPAWREGVAAELSLIDGRETVAPNGAGDQAISSGMPFSASGFASVEPVSSAVTAPPGPPAQWQVPDRAYAERTQGHLGLTTRSRIPEPFPAKISHLSNPPSPLSLTLRRPPVLDDTVFAWMSVSVLRAAPRLTAAGAPWSAGLGQSDLGALR